jgi:GNAT superfamily N-acetyltransferase/predicted nucleic acid-binding protein
MQDRREQFSIITNPSEVGGFVDQVCRAADSDRMALGFLPPTAYSDAAAQGKLWVAVTQVAGKPSYAGHILFGRAFPILRVFQVFVTESFRRRGVASALLRRLIKEAESLNYLIVNAKVAGDLEANRFWEAHGFSVIRTTVGGGARTRQIFLRERRLSTPSLFDLLEAPSAPTDHDLRLVDRLYKRAPVYVLDVNVLLDLLKNRDRAEDVRQIVSAAMAGAVSLYAAPELVQELRKSTPRAGDDPVLQFASTLPQFPVPPEAEGKHLDLELGGIIFPERSRRKCMRARDRSDLMHIATAIYNRAVGFVTSEKAILRCQKILWERFGLEIVGVTELAESLSPAEWNPHYEHRASQSTGTEIGSFVLRENERSTVERFLASFGLEETAIRDALAPGYAESPRRRFVIKVSGQIHAYASWDPPQAISSHIDAFITATHAEPALESGLDNALMSLMRDASQHGPSVVRICAIPRNETVKRIATSAGFRPIAGGEQPDSEWLQKVCLGRVVCENNWDAVRGLLLSRTKIGLPSIMPRYVGPGTAVSVASPQGTCLCLPLHELEDLFGPSLLVLRGRPGAIVPIRKEYAAQLLNVSSEANLFPYYEASILSRRAYMSHVRALSATAPGTVLLFYESQRGGGQGAVVACARSVENALSPTKELPLSIKARGVLEDTAIERIGASGRTGVTLFDSIFRISRPVRLEHLRRLGCVDRSNLVTSRMISPERLQSILREGMPHV